MNKNQFIIHMKKYLNYEFCYESSDNDKNKVIKKPISKESRIDLYTNYKENYQILNQKKENNYE